MKTIYTFLIFISVLSLTSAKAQTPALRGIYVDKFSQILGNTTKEDSLLHYAQDSSFNYLALYDLQNISFSSSTSINKLANFIRNARENYGIQYVGAVCESYSSFQTKIAPYNNGRSNPNDRFNVFNLEFEFWISSSVNPGAYYCTQYLIQNNCSCDTSGAFKFYIDQMRKIDSLATLQNALSETYVGWFNQGQGQQIASNTDRVLVHAYRTDPSSVFGYSKARLGYLASLNQQVDVVPIFSAEPDFMGPWLNTHSMTEAYSKYTTDFNADNSSWKPYIRLLGYQWFDYGHMPKPVPGAPSNFTPVITSSGSTNFCSGGTVTLTATAGSNYLWSNGATSQAITISTAGSYTCQVTQNSVTKTTAVTTVTVNDPPTASFIIANSSTGNVVLSSTSTAGSGTISSYQWYFNGNAIGAATSSSYTASSNGDYSVRVYNSNGCNQTSPVQTISVPVAACQLTTPSGCAALNVSTTSVMLSWNNPAPCDSVIVRYNREGTNTYTYIRMAYTGGNMVTISNVIPNARYSWRVKTGCGTQFSGYSSKKYFSTHSAVVSVAHAPEARAEKIPTDIQQFNDEFLVYPNPVKDQMRLNFFSEQDQQAELILSDIAGRSFLSRPIEVIEGDNTITLNTSEIPSGYYLAQVRTGDVRRIKRILIQN
jgi:hypothetical protein